MSARRNILIVEDDNDLRGLFRMALQMAGYAIRDVGDGYEALQALDEYTPDLVVLDLGLPRVHGRSVREEMLARTRTREIPVVVVTGSGGTEIDHLSAECVLTKPATPEHLVEVVQRCLGGSSAPPQSSGR